MISERKLASAYTSFWRQTMPMEDSFVRAINRKLTRRQAPIESTCSRQRRADLNELAFKLFRFPDALMMEPISQSEDSEISAIIGEVFSEDDFVVPEDANTIRIRERELEEVKTIAKRLTDFFASLKGSSEILISPAFPGCGILSESEGDVLVNQTLYEVKAGDRDFRVIDVRQLMVYCAMNYEARKYLISRIGLYNPRLGLEFSIDLDEAVKLMAGRVGTDLFHTIVEFVTRELPSK